ncbi:MAG: sigma-54 dependent transcriptional regulator [Myxococcota bacterium]
MKTPSRVLIIDDDEQARMGVSKLVESQGYDVTCARDGREGLDILESEQIDVVLVDMHMPRMGGLEVLQEARNKAPNSVCIVVSADGHVDLANECLDLGAFDYLEKPISNFHHFDLKLQRAAEMAQLRWETALGRDDPAELRLIGNSEGMVAVRRLIRQVAATPAIVQIHGESGTGKEVVARLIHEMSGKPGNFVDVNCGALPSTLEEDHLFGHVKGAFSGAIRDYEGVFGGADEGTIFLDEIGDMPSSLQVKLLRAIQDRTYRPIGSMKALEVTARFITATHRDLEAEVRAGRFRQDLLFRLDVVNIELPPLRARREDIRPLALRFVHEFNQRYRKTIRFIDPDAMRLLEDAPWPGNVRQLRNEIERAIAIGDGDTLTPDQLFERSRPGDPPPAVGPAIDPAILGMSWTSAKDEVIARFAKVYLTHHLERTGWVIARAAESARMARPNFSKLMKKYGVTVPDPDEK